jgi:hypothetical protein
MTTPKPDPAAADAGPGPATGPAVAHGGPRVTPYYEPDGSLIFRLDVGICGQMLILDEQGDGHRSVTLWCLVDAPDRAYYALDGVEHEVDNRLPPSAPHAGDGGGGGEGVSGG